MKINAPLLALFSLSLLTVRIMAVQWPTNDTVYSWGPTTLPEGQADLIATSETRRSSLGVLPDGRVLGWGMNLLGSLDIPADLTNAVDVVAGASFGAAITREGTVRTWGLLSLPDRPSVAPPADLDNVKAVAVGAGQVLALRADGTVAAWGDNICDQCLVPPGLSNVVAVRAGAFLSVALQADGRVAAWGQDHVGLPADLTNVADIALTLDCALVARRGGAVEAYCGNFGSSLLNVPAGLTNVVRIVANESQAVVLTADGRVTVWPATFSWPQGLEGVTTIDAGGQHCMVSSPLPWVIVPPTNQAVLPGATVEFGVVATNRFPLVYQWQYDGVDLPGETNATLRLSSVGLDDTGYYRVAVRAGDATNTAGAGLSVGLPVILRQPSDLTCDERSEAVMSVEALSSEAVAYQWMRDDLPIEGATNATLVLTDVQIGQSGSYSVSVSNTFGAVLSGKAVLQVESASVVDQTQPISGRTVTLRGTPGRREVVAQTFTPGMSGRLDALDLAVWFSPRDPLLIQVVETFEDRPGDRLLGYAVLHEDQIPTARFDLQDIYLVAGRSYALVMSTAGQPGRYQDYTFHTSMQDVYGGGRLWVRTDAGWDPIDDIDLVFTTHMFPHTPDVRLETPWRGTRCRVGDTVSLRAALGPQGEPPARVDFFANDLPVASATQEPYAAEWIAPAAGLHRLTAVAVGSTLIATSRVVEITVLAPGPANDDFESRLALSGTSVRTTVTNHDATAQPGEPELTGTRTGQTVWWSWTAPLDGLVTVGVAAPAETNAVLGVYRGTVLEGLYSVATGTGACSFEAAAGDELQIMLDSRVGALDTATLQVAVSDIELTAPKPGAAFTAPALVQLSARILAPGRTIRRVEFRAGDELLGSDTTEPFTLQAQIAQPGYHQLRAIAFDDVGMGVESPPVLIVVRPGHDAFANAIAVSGHHFETHTANIAASMEGVWEPGMPDRWVGEPRWADNLGGHSLWYSWTAPEDGVCRVEGRGQGFGLLLAAYTGSEVARLASIAANPYSGTGTPIEWTAIAGTTYWICVDGLYGEEGELDWSLHFGPKNDRFDERTRLLGPQTTVLASMRGALLEPGEAAMVGTDTAGSAWWSWTAPDSARVVVSTSSEDLDSRLLVFVGGALDALTPVAASPATWGRTARAEFDAAAGVEYQIVVLADGGSIARLRFEIAMQLPQLASPLPGSIHAAPATLDLAVMMPPALPEPRQVEYYANDALVSRSEGPPFVTRWEQIPPGTHTLRVRVLGADGRIYESVPTSILVYADGAPPKPQLIVPLRGSSSYVVNAIGELHAFGAVGPLFGQARENILWPALRRWPETTGRWQQVLEPGIGWAIAADGSLWRDGSERLDFPPGVTRWVSISQDRDGILLAVGDDGRVYQHGTTPLPLEPAEAVWTDVGANLIWIATLAQDGRAFVHAWNWTGFDNAEVARPPGVQRWRRIGLFGYGLILWGSNGRLYDANPYAQEFLRLIEEPEGVTSWIDFATGGNFVVTIGDDGQLYSWDTLTWTRVPLPPGVRSWTAVAAGDRHTLAIGDDCQLYALGANDSGQLGLGSTASQVIPMPVPFVGNLCGIPIIYTQGETSLLPDGSFRLVFRSDLNRRYLIQYSEDAIDWKNAMPPLIGSGEVTEWIDDGPPKTETHPSGASRRYYRVAFAP